MSTKHLRESQVFDGNPTSLYRNEGHGLTTKRFGSLAGGAIRNGLNCTTEFQQRYPCTHHLDKQNTNVSVCDVL